MKVKRKKTPLVSPETHNEALEAIREMFEDDKIEAETRSRAIQIRIQNLQRQIAKEKRL